MIILCVLIPFLFCKNIGNRLESTVIPSHYNLHFTIKKEGFSGTTTIELIPSSDTKTIVLNSEDLKIESVKIEGFGETYSGEWFTSINSVKLSFKNILSSGIKYKLTIEYSGKYSKNLDGIYFNNNGDGPIYSTHFEPTYARKAFPCFDQPDLKASFSISIASPKGYTVLSNSSVEKYEDGIYYFNETKPMSTYLVAFVVGKLKHVETKSKRNIPIRIYANDHDIKLAKFSLQVAKFCLDFFETYFKIKYPFPKLDLVGIPSFANGAMENWGLITFRKSSLFFNEETGTTSAKINVANTICHELAHMWFGNLVTMAWWNDLWLNEGFASWAASLAMTNLPKKVFDMDVWLFFINEELEKGMIYDSLHSSHPVAVNVSDPQEISQIFDNISYNKGASIIRMIENFIGHEKFREGLQRYLADFKYKNSKTLDLFRYQDKPSEIKNITNSWIYQEGFPIIIVKDEGEYLNFTQTRFLLGKKNHDDKTWVIPLTIMFVNEEEETYLITKKEFKLRKKSNLYKINLRNVGMYRVLYEKKIFASLLKVLDDPKERLNIINDMLNLAFGNYIEMKWVLETIKSNIKDEDTEVLKALLLNLRRICNVYYNDSKTYFYIKNMIHDIIDPYKNKISIENSGKTLTEKLKNSLIVSFGLFVEDEFVVSKLKDGYVRYMNNNKHVSPDYIENILSSVVDEKLDEIIEIYQSTDKNDLKLIIIKALARCKDKENLNRVLFNFTTFDRQNMVHFFEAASKNDGLKQHIEEFFIERYEDIKNFISNDSILNNAMEAILSSESDPVMVEKISKFLSSVKNEGSERSVGKIKEKNQIYLEFRRNNQNLI